VRDGRPLIGVTIGNRPERDGSPRLAINRPYVSALQAAGGDVVLLPPSAPLPPPVGLLDSLDGLLVPGGLDIDPRRYRQEPRSELGPTDCALDELELAMVRAAAERGLPVLGICRGQQVVNVALGGDLYQDLVADGLTERPHATELALGRDHLAHAIEICPGSRLSQVLDGAVRINVNSFHHQAVRQVAPSLNASAFSVPDRVIEALESSDGRVLCLQCHPEELTAGHGWARLVFNKFVEAAAR
jgi:putative glutamine amidotransferase